MDEDGPRVGTSTETSKTGTFGAKLTAGRRRTGHRIGIPRSAQTAAYQAGPVQRLGEPLARRSDPGWASTTCAYCAHAEPHRSELRPGPHGRPLRIRRLRRP